MGAIHDHATWVAISPIVGLETHRRYRVVGEGSAARPEVVETLALRPSDLATLLPPDDLHDHGHLAGHGDPAWVLIMTGDDQRRFRRNEWDLVDRAAPGPRAGRRRPLARRRADARRLISGRRNQNDSQRCDAIPVWVTCAAPTLAGRRPTTGGVSRAHT